MIRDAIRDRLRRGGRLPPSKNMIYQKVSVITGDIRVCLFIFFFFSETYILFENSEILILDDLIHGLLNYFIVVFIFTNLLLKIHYLIFYQFCYLILNHAGMDKF